VKSTGHGWAPPIEVTQVWGMAPEAFSNSRPRVAREVGNVATPWIPQLGIGFHLLTGREAGEDHQDVA
jgi:hypothetical protein